MEILYWMYQLFREIQLSEGGSWDRVSPAAHWSQICNKNRRLWDSKVSQAQCTDMHAQLSHHLNVLSSQVSKQQACSDGEMFSLVVQPSCLSSWKSRHYKNPWLRSTCVSSAHFQVGSCVDDANLPISYTCTKLDLWMHTVLLQIPSLWN